MKKSLEEVYLG